MFEEFEIILKESVWVMNWRWINYRGLVHKQETDLWLLWSTVSKKFWSFNKKAWVVLLVKNHDVFGVLCVGWDPTFHILEICFELLHREIRYNLFGVETLRIDIWINVTFVVSSNIFLCKIFRIPSRSWLLFCRFGGWRLWEMFWVRTEDWYLRTLSSVEFFLQSYVYVELVT